MERILTKMTTCAEAALAEAQRNCARTPGKGDESIRCFAVVGFCGGFTTFSTFPNETFRLLENSQWLPAAGYAGLSLVAGLAAGSIGYLISKGV